MLPFFAFAIQKNIDLTLRVLKTKRVKIRDK